MNTDTVTCAVLTVLLTNLGHVVVLGFCYSAGLYQVEFLRVFSGGVTVTSLAASLNLGFFHFAGDVCLQGKIQDVGRPQGPLDPGSAPAAGGLCTRCGTRVWLGL